MNLGPLLKLSVVVPVEAEEAVADLLEAVFRQPVAMSTDADTLRTTVSVFCERPASFTSARAARVTRGLADLRAAGQAIGRARLRSETLAPRNWAEAWKRHFKTLEFGRTLLVRPGWSRRRPRPGQAEVVLDPGLSFGTGHHPTTAFCLSQVVAGRPRAGRSVGLLDIGTGSGILAIAAVKLGYTPVSAFDFDPAAVRVARENAAVNGVTEQLEIARHDLTRLPARPERQYAVVAANLLAPLLLAERDRIIARVAPGGRLVLAGILAREFGDVRAHYAAAGLRPGAARTVKEWCSGAFHVAG